MHNVTAAVRGLIAASLLLSVAAPGSAEEEVTLLSELKTITEKAKAERAADRWLQRDLDDLVSRYDKPKLRELVLENFQDRRFVPADGWRFTGTQSQFDRGYGLVSTVDPNASDSIEEEQSSSGRELSREEAVADLLVGLLLKDQREEPEEPAEDERPSRTSEPGEPAKAVLPASIPNAFLVELELTLTETSEESRVEFSVYQSSAEHYGYNLKLKTGKRGFIEIERQRQQRRSIIDSQDLAETFEDGESHSLAWLQDANGRILVTLDDKIILDTVDKAFKDDYEQFNISNQAGELAVHLLKISG